MGKMIIELHVAEHPVGFPMLVDKFERQCHMNGRGRGKARIAGICGMGGAGKTTLSKELYNRYREKYTRASFLSGVREACKRGNLVFLQQRLLEDLFNEVGRSFSGVDEGISYLKDRLARIPVVNFLIVLDDIDHLKQLQSLLVPDMANKSGDSLIIISTRDAGVLAQAEIPTFVMLEGLEEHEATELFCLHAFGQRTPNRGYEDLVDGFVQGCKGLPLSLQILGSHVKRRDEEFWNSTLKKLGKAQNLHKDIKEVLQISIDSLDSSDKEIFMDVACFFIGYSKNLAESVWKASRWEAHHALEVLKDKFIVEEIEAKNEDGLKREGGGIVLGMHDHLRDLGRELASQATSPRRLYQPEVLKSSGSTGEFIKIIRQTKVRCFHSFLNASTGTEITYFIAESNDWGETRASFIWLQLDLKSLAHESIPQSIPSWIPLEKLQCLRICNGRLTRLWEGPSQFPFRLRELRISQCFGFSSLPEELCHLESLEHLQFTTCPMLSSFPPLCHLQSLEHLQFTSCPMLSSLPHFGDLRNLRYLDLSDCEQLEELPLSFEKLTCLKYIRLSRCCKLKLRLDMLENITQLEHLELTRCHELKGLPRLVTLSPLQLRELRVNQCFQGSSLPEELCALQSLERLELTGCPTLSSLPRHFGKLRNLRYLDLSNCERLEELPDSFYQLISLESIRLSYCEKLKLRLDMLKNITKLKYLDLTGCHLLEELPRLVPVLPLQLTELRISQCFGVTSLPEELCDLKSLQILELSCCPMLSSLPSRFGDLRNLRHLDLSCCWKLKLRLDMLENITMLEYLNLTRCHEVEELPHNISYQVNLKRLFVEGTSIKDLPANIGKLWNLEELKIGSPMLTSLPPSLGELTCLNTLVIDCCVQLQDLPPSLCNLDLLKQLTIRGSGLKELPFGVGSSNIEITGQQVEASNSGFNSRASVTENYRQTIWNAFKRMTEKCLKALWNALKCLLINKRRITGHGSPQTHVHKKIPAGVETLSLVANPQLMEIQALPESLKNLEIYACRKLRKMSGVDHLLKLHRLEICSCPDLEELPSFAGLTSLQEFKIQGCPKLQIIQGLEFSKSLQILTAEVRLIRSLESAEELTRVELTSHTMSDLKSCILSMKKCPREAMIRATVASNIVQSLPLNNLSVLRLEEDSEWDNITQDLFNGPFLWYLEENVSDNEESGRSGSKVVQIAVCTGGSSAFPEYCVRRRTGSNTKEKLSKAVLARGDDENVVSAFNQLIGLLE